MKKFFAILMAVAIFASMATVASAAENTTTLTTTVPAASYTLNIPADQEIPFGATKTDIGNITVTNSSGFADGKNLSVTATYSAFTANGISTQIPYVLKLQSGTRSDEWASGTVTVFEGKSNGTVEEKTTIMTPGNTGVYSPSPVDAVLLVANSEDWGKALGGVYTSTITFTCEVVVEQ